MNKALLGVGFFIMVVGTSILIYMTIKAEGSKEETSDSVKKILLNFLQMVSLAAGLPLQWPAELVTMFDGMSTLSSAGSSLLIPDCELTHFRPADAFYMKQIGFTFAVPVIVAVCGIAWIIIMGTCAKACRLRTKELKNYFILSVVLILFLFYPMLVRLTLSMLKCPWIGTARYLMADLQEPCFAEGSRHVHYVLLLTLPQIIFYVIGLPLAATLIIVKTSTLRLKTSPSFKMRYGLLYIGYRDGREWWEIVIAIRKVAVVAIGTFGTLFRAVDLQAFLALAVVFCAILIHLIGSPYDLTRPKMRMLHNLEFASLIVCWWTFWGGLIFFLGPTVVSKEVSVVMTVCILCTNFVFTMIATLIFGKEFVRETLEKKKNIGPRRTLQESELEAIAPSQKQNVKNTKVLPTMDAVKDWK